MTNNEAIKRIKEHCEIHFKLEYPNAIKITEALRMAIEALEQQEKDKWIPVSERLPEEYKVEVLTMPERNYTKSDTVHVTYFENGNRCTSNDYTVEGTWIMNANVIAWKPMPEEYKGK